MGGEKIYQENSEDSKAGVATLTSGEIDSEMGSVQRQRRTSRADKRVSSLGRHNCKCACA